MNAVRYADDGTHARSRCPIDMRDIACVLASQFAICLLILVSWVAAAFSRVFDVGGNLCLAAECDEPGVHYWSRPCIGATFLTHDFDLTREMCVGIPLGDMRCTGYPTAASLEEEPMPCPKP
ncbi:MAG: hypothetical protein AMXMBFR22_33150 [Phycisphaerae bacterium]